MKFSFIFAALFFLIIACSSISIVFSPVRVEAARLGVAAPVIGIFTNDASWCGQKVPEGVTANSCVEGFYVRWLEDAGIRVIPFPWNASTETQRKLAEKINGVFFPGGGLGGELLDYYVSKVRNIVNWAIEWNKQGDHFNVIGTCMGFQVIAAALAGSTKVIEGPYPDMYPRMMSLNFTTAQPTSRTFGTNTTPADILIAAHHRRTTLNWHHDIVSPETFRKYPELERYVTPITVNNVPDSDTVFVANYEGKMNINIFAAQWHAERPPFEFTNPGIGHDAATIAVSQYLSGFYAEKLKECHHQFDTLDELEEHIIERNTMTYYGWGHELYWIQDPT